MFQIVFDFVIYEFVLEFIIKQNYNCAMSFKLTRHHKKTFSQSIIPMVVECNSKKVNHNLFNEFAILYFSLL